MGRNEDHKLQEEVGQGIAKGNGRVRSSGGKLVQAEDQDARSHGQSYYPSQGNSPGPPPPPPLSRVSQHRTLHGH